MEIKPFTNYILIEPTHEVKSENLVIQEQADQEPTNKGVVVSFGVETKLPIAVGQTVYFKPHLFEDIVIDGKTLLIGREDGLIASC